MTTSIIVASFVALLLLSALISSFTIVRPYEKKALTVFGDFWRTLGPGINFVPPFVSHLHTYDMREQTINVPEQDVITKDNAPVTADAVIYTKIQNVERTFLEIEDHRRAVQNLSQTSLRAVIGNMDLDDTLNRRSELNTRIQEELAEPTDNWGISVERVEIKNISPSSDVRDAMEKQSAAERKRRAMVTEAKGQKRSQILEAEGEKQSRIVRAEGEKEERIRTAQGEAEAIYLKAMASQTMGEQALIVRSLEATEQAAKEDSNTFFMPFEFSDTVGRLGRNLDAEGLSENGLLDGKALEELSEGVQNFLDPEKIKQSMEDIGDIDIDDEDVEESGNGTEPLEAEAQPTDAGDGTIDDKDGSDA